MYGLTYPLASEITLDVRDMAAYEYLKHIGYTALPITGGVIVMVWTR
jgi:hypothetical protein